MQPLGSRPLSGADLEAMVERGKLLAILDACDDPQVYEKVVELGPDRALCLHGGDLDEEERQTAPYLVRVDHDLLAWIMSEPWGRPWGIFVVADCDPRSLRPHLRASLTARGAEGEPMYLRYHDPRVTPKLPELLTEEQLEELFGPTLGLAVPGDDQDLPAILYHLA